MDLLYLIPAVQPKQIMPSAKAMDYREQVYIAARDGNIMFLKVIFSFYKKSSNKNLFDHTHADNLTKILIWLCAVYFVQNFDFYNIYYQMKCSRLCNKTKIEYFSKIKKKKNMKTTTHNSLDLWCTYNIVHVLKYFW